MVLKHTLASRWVLERKRPPPVRFRRLLELDSFDSAVALQVNRLLTAKCQAMEGDTAVPNPLLHIFLEQQLKPLTQH